MLKRTISCAAVVLVSVLSAPTLGQDDKPSSIEQLAPENSVFVAGATDFSASLDRLKNTRFWAFWDSPDGRTLRDKFDEAMQEALDEISDELDMEMEEFPVPSGAAGFALFTVEDDETGMPRPGILAYGDFGEDAEQMYDLLQRMVERGEDDDAILLEEIVRLDRDGWRIEFVEQEEDDADGMNGEEEWEQWDDGPSGPPFDAIELIKEGSMLVVCTDREALEQMLLARDGEDIESVGDRDDYQAVKGKIGEGELYGAVLMRDFWETMGAFQDGGGGMGMMMMPQMLEQFLGRIDGAGWTLSLDTATAMVEQTWFVHMPAGKKGLLTLIGSESARPRVPAFVSPEAASYLTLNVDTDAIGPFVRQMMENPMIGGGMDAQQRDDVVRRISEVFATMGNELHFTTRIKRPLAADSQRMLFALECEKPQEFETLIAEEAPQIGLVSRDFLGQRIYELDMGGGMGASETWSLGIGGGYVLIGPSAEVELALRAAGGDEPVTLEGDIDFKRVMSATSAERAIAWAFADMVETIDTGMRVAALQQRQMAEEFREFAPDYADQMLENAKEMEQQLDEIPPADVLRRYIGPAAWYVRSIDEGLLGKSYILPGRDE